MLSRLPLDRQLVSLRDVLSRNELLMDVLDRAAVLDLPGWYVSAGCLVQTVWNVVTDRPPANGIRDYDVFYFDDEDLSWEAEDRVIAAGRRIFGDLPASDVFNLVMRPNPVLAPGWVYESKAKRWREHWPELTSMQWPSGDPERR
jgi:hypothetical protein